MVDELYLNKDVWKKRLNRRNGKEKRNQVKAFLAYGRGVNLGKGMNVEENVIFKEHTDYTTVFNPNEKTVLTCVKETAIKEKRIIQENSIKSELCSVDRGKSH